MDIHKENSENGEGYKDPITQNVKAVEHLLTIHEAQVITYMKLADVSVGLLMNFNVKLLREGIRRLFPSPSPLSLSFL